MDETYAPIWCQTPTFVKSAYREYLIGFLRKFFIFGANLETSIKSLYCSLPLLSLYQVVGPDHLQLGLIL